MGLTKKQQLLAKIETSEGVDAAPGAGDAVSVDDIAMSDDPDITDVVTTGPTLSRDFAPVGRRNRQITFKQFMRGSGDTTVPVDEPEYARFLRAAGYKVSTVRKVTLGAVTGTGFQVGEIVTQSSGAIRGVVVGAFTSGGALVNRLATSGGHLAVVPLVGTFTAAATAGASSGSTSTASAVAAYEGYVLQTTSEKLLSCTTATWSGGTPAAVGEVLSVEDATTGVALGEVQVVADTSGGTYTDLVLELVWGSIANGNRLRNAAGTGTGVLNAAPTQTLTPSISFRRHRAGRRKPLLGARGDFTVEAEVGKPLQFSWEFSGDPGTDVDEPPVTTSAVTTVRPPRMLGSILCYGRGAEVFRLPTKRISLANGGVVTPNLDGNRAGGSTGSFVTDRDPAFTFTVDETHGFGWEALRDAGTPVRVSALLGETKGNIVGLVIPNAQVTEVAEGDADGVATYEITVKPRKIAESGDDDLFLVQL